MTASRRSSSWWRRAACRGLPTGLFYPPPEGSAAEALAVCARCSVRAACEQHALEMGEEYGIWGGRTEAERARMQRDGAASRRRRGRRGPAPALSDDDLLDVVWQLDPARPAAEQLRRRLGVSKPTAYKYLHRARLLGGIVRRGGHLYPT